MSIEIILPYQSLSYMEYLHIFMLPTLTIPISIHDLGVCTAIFFFKCYGKWYKLDFDLYGNHTKKKLFVMALLIYLQNYNNSCK